MISSESTSLRISSAPSRALSIFFSPSNMKGTVTMPMVSMPHSFAILATTGAAPVPVPPPIPAVMNTISVSSLKSDFMLSALASAHWRPTSGTLPAPRPWVISWPRSSLLGTGESFSACSSVLHTTKLMYFICWLNI